jgi:hypothetical protein
MSEIAERFVAGRVTHSYRQEIDAGPDEVFPLLCPVRERDWLHGWDCEMVYSESGYAEEGAVFTTRGEAGEADTIWLITRRDEQTHTIQFARITPDSRAVKLDIAVTGDGAGRSHVDIRYQFTALNETGNRFTHGYTEEKFLRVMRFWERSMNHYLATGRMLVPAQG